MNNKIINPLTGKYVNINSNEGREILNYYTNTSIDFLIGGEPRKDRSVQKAEAETTLAASPPAPSAPSVSAPIEEEQPEKCIAMHGATGTELSPIKQSAKSVAQLYQALLQPIKHTAIPQIARIAYHLLGKNKQAKTMLINERGKQKLCEAVRSKYNDLNTKTIKQIEDKLEEVLKEAEKKRQRSDEETIKEDGQLSSGGGKMDYKNDENFIELSDKLSKVTRMLVNSYNAEGYTPELRNNLNELMYNTLENMALMHIIFEMHNNQSGGTPTVLGRKPTQSSETKSSLQKIQHRLNLEAKHIRGTNAAVASTAKTIGDVALGNLKDLSNIARDSSENLLNKASKLRNTAGTGVINKASILATKFNESLNPADASQGLKSVMNKLNFNMPNISSTNEGFLVGMLLPLYSAGMKLPWQMQEMAIKQFDQKLQLLNNCDSGLNKICQLIEQLIDNHGCEQVCEDIAAIINEILHINTGNLTKYNDSLMDMAKKGRALAGVGKKMASKAIGSASSAISQKVSSKLGIPNLSTIIPKQEILEILRSNHFDDKDKTITDIITDFQLLYDSLDDATDKDEIQTKIDALIDKIKAFFIELPPNEQSSGESGEESGKTPNRNPLSILHYYQLELEKFRESNEGHLGKLSKIKDELKGKLMKAYTSSEFGNLKEIWRNRKNQDGDVTITQLKESLKRMMNIKAGLKKIIELILIPARSILGDRLIDSVVKKIEKFIESSDKKIQALSDKIHSYTSLDKLKDFIIQNDKDGELLNKFLPRLTDIKFISGDDIKLKSLRDELNSFLDERRKKYPGATVHLDESPKDTVEAEDAAKAIAEDAANTAEAAAGIAMQAQQPPMPPLSQPPQTSQMSMVPMTPMTPINPEQMQSMTQQMFMMMMMDYMQNMSGRTKPKKRFGLF